MKVASFLFFIFLAFFFCSTAFSQQKNSKEHIVEALEKYNGIFRQEKLYVHFDKEYYLPGDTIWFKAYKVNASTHEPDSASRVIYLDLISPQNILVSQLKLKSDSGFSHGDFLLSDTLQSGTYKVRAYTNWMRNFDPDFFFTKAIPIYALKNTGSDTVLKAQINGVPKLLDTSGTEGKKHTGIDLQFFPEGGNLLTGIPGAVAFKALSTSGKGLAVKGSIVDNKGNFVSSFGSNNLGMGVFNLLPQAEKQYFARLDGGSSEKGMLPLPLAIEEGYTLSISYFKPRFIRVNARTNVRAASPSQPHIMTIVGQCRGEVYFSAKANINRRGYFFVDVPKTTFPSGIVQFTLFDDRAVPQSERLAFVNHMDELNIDVETDKKVYSPKEKVELNIQVTDEEGDPVNTNLSLSVTDAAQVPVIDSLKDNIVTSLLLSSDLKGYIESPQLYLRDTTKHTLQELDLLMLTHGWRRFSWKEVLKDTLSIARFSHEKGLSFSGKIEDVKSKNPIDGNRFTMMVMSDPVQVLQSEVGKENDFKFQLPEFQDTVSVVLQTNNARGKQKDMKVWVDETVIPDLENDFIRPDTQFPEVIKPALIRREKEVLARKVKSKSGANVLGEVVVKAKTQAQKAGIYSLQKIDVEQLEKSMTFDYINVFHLIAARGKGVFRVEGSRDGELLMAGMGKNQHLPVFVINGIVYEPDRFTFPYPYLLARDVETRRIKYLEIGEKFSFEGRFIKHIIINTYQDGFRRSYPAGINTFRVAGFSRVREFYSPRYQTRVTNKPIDERFTIYWNPRVQTDRDGKAKLTFYNSDKAARFSLNVEGISEIGDIGELRREIDVK